LYQQLRQYWYVVLANLAREDSARALVARVHLVLHHMLELLAVDGPEEDVGWDRLAGDARGEELFAAEVVAVNQNSNKAQTKATSAFAWFLFLFGVFLGKEHGLRTDEGSNGTKQEGGTNTNYTYTRTSNDGDSNDDCLLRDFSRMQ
jgi:uncharacterized protein YhhL (DUF1145 family)